MLTHLMDTSIAMDRIQDAHAETLATDKAYALRVRTQALARLMGEIAQIYTTGDFVPSWQRSLDERRPWEELAQSVTDRITGGDAAPLVRTSDLATAIGRLFCALERELPIDVIASWSTVARLLGRENWLGYYECGTCGYRSVALPISCKRGCLEHYARLLPAGPAFHLQQLRDWTDLRALILAAIRNHQEPNANRHWRHASDAMRSLEYAWLGTIS